jgi:hypothetical protein
LPGTAKNPSSWSKPSTPSNHLSKGGYNAPIEQKSFSKSSAFQPLSKDSI